MLTLAIETSGRTGAVALRRDRSDVQERRLQQAGRRHAQTLVAEIDDLLNSHGLSPHDIRLVAVSIGPGSFTGLRVGVTCAKTFAWATGAALVAVDTFACIAENSPADMERLYVIGDAQRGDLYVGEYQREALREFTRQERIRIVPAEQWCRARSATDVVAGPGVEAYQDLLSGRCRLLPAELSEPRAAVVAWIGERELQGGRTADPFSLEPFYLRKSAAEEKWDAERG